MSDRTIEYDLKFLLAVLNWAARSRDEEGRLLLESNPPRGLKTPRQKNPARVLLTDAEYQAMLRASLLMDWRFRVALVIAHETGHRIGAIRQLRWSAIDMEGRTIRWRAEHEKTGHEHRTPVTAEALEASTPNVPARTRTWGLLLRRQSLYPPELRGLLELTGIRRPMSVIYVCQLEAERPPRYSSMALLSRSASGLW